MEKAELYFVFLLQLILVHIWYIFKLDLVYPLYEALAILVRTNSCGPCFLTTTGSAFAWIVANVVLPNIFLTSALCTLCTSCRSGEAVQSVGRGHCVCLLIAPHA